VARGWESKSVESQQAEAEAERHAPAHRPLTDTEREREAKRLTLSLARVRVLQDLQTACHPNHRAMLEQSLSFIDREIEALADRRNLLHGRTSA
jgi:hypothetical protein